MLKIMGTFIKILKIEEIGSYSAVADKKGEIEKNQKVIKELQDIGRRLSK